MGGIQFGIYELPKMMENMDDFLLNFRDEVVEKFFILGEVPTLQATIADPVELLSNDQQTLVLGPKVIFNYAGKLKIKCTSTTMQGGATNGTVQIYDGAKVLAAKEILTRTENIGTPQEVDLEFILNASPTNINIGFSSPTYQTQKIKIENIEIYYDLEVKRVLPGHEIVGE